MLPSIIGAPTQELLRSPAAQRVGELAAQSGLLLSHFEHRLDLELPDDWEPVDRPDLGTDGGWRGGHLPESKYRSFRHDRIIGSFHPSHRAKWTAHELCHGLVGFAWTPGCSRFFQVLSARLSEVLPVALYYFFDEAGLRRCPTHDGGGPLFGTFCADCEEAATRGSVEDPSADQWRLRGMEFLERELDAVHRSIQLGHIVPHRLHTLDLGSDGLGYAAAHGPRLDSPEFARWVELFCTEGEGWFTSLDSLQSRVQSLADDLCGKEPARPWRADTWMWRSQDLGSRLLQVQADCGGELRPILDELIQALAANPTAQGVTSAIESYTALSREWVLPQSAQIFAVGYTLPGGHGHALDQLQDGIESGLPMTSTLLADELRGHIESFALCDPVVRLPLGERFIDHLPEGSALHDLARMEAAIAHAPPADLEAETLAGAGEPPFRLRRGLSLLTFRHQVDQALDPGWRAQPALPEPRDTLLHLAVFRSASGEVQVLELSPAAMQALRDMTEDDLLRLDEEERLSLLHWGVLWGSQTA